MTMKTTERAAEVITRAYGVHETQTEPRAWTSLRSLAERTDLTHDELKRGAHHLAMTSQFHLMPESNQKILTPLDRELAVWLGGEWNHLIRRD